MQSIKHYAHRFKELGVRGSLGRIRTRFNDYVQPRLRKRAAQRGRLNHSWNTVRKQHNLESDFATFFAHVQKQNYISRVANHEMLRTYLPESFTDKNKLLEEAEKACQGIVQLLGSEQYKLDMKKNCWHFDFKCEHGENLTFGARKKTESVANWQTTPRLFYKDIVIDRGTSNDFDIYLPDIKVPWELSRFQHLSPLFFANKVKAEPFYAQTFVRQVDAWIDSNPLLLGANWVCPMDVGIRALNFIWGIETFKHDASVPEHFWKKLICSLYDHAWYLERHWELSDKPSNHYLSDLVGYLAICSLFSDLDYFEKQFVWCQERILEQADIQLGDEDGTSYEGSTNYHKLVTELFLHAGLLSTAHSKKLPEWFDKKLSRALQFIDYCTDNAGNFVQIGDNDSGKIVTGLQAPHIDRPEQLTLSHHANFGLSIIRDEHTHISFRHPTYNQRQPSGHFHHDYLSATLSAHGIPILVDPGTYLYTANGLWRRHFRNIESHNTFYPSQKLPEHEHLFQLDRPEQVDTLIREEKDEYVSVANYHDTFIKVCNLRAHRRMSYNRANKTLELEDWWTSHGKIAAGTTHWNFTFHPDIHLEKAAEQSWNVLHQGSRLCTFTSDIVFEKVESYYSPGYGIMEKTEALRGSIQTTPEKRSRHSFVVGEHCESDGG